MNKKLCPYRVARPPQGPVPSRFIKIFMNSALLLLFLIFHTGAGPETAFKRITLDKKFFSELHNTPPISRDSYLEGMLNSIVFGKGIVVSAYSYQRLKKNYRLVLVDPEAGRKNLNISYYIYTADQNIATVVEKDALFEFTGQLIAYTPMNSNKDSYIFDILLEKGTVLLK